MKEVQLLRSLNDGNLSSAKRLLEAGADCNHVLQEEGVAGVAPMHMAVGLGLDALRLLLQYGGDPNVRSEEGVTPLHIAATWGELDSVKLLLFNGGDPSIHDQEGLRAVDVARKYNHDEVACYLQYYALLLVPDDNMQIRYTRESLEVHRDSVSPNMTSEVLNQSFLDDSAPDKSDDTCARPSYSSSADGISDQKKLWVGTTTSPWQHRHTCCGKALDMACRDCDQTFMRNGDLRKRIGCRRNEQEVCGQCRWRESEGRYRGRAEVTFTDSDPDCCEVCSEDEVRCRLRDFHSSCVTGHRPDSNTNNNRHFQYDREFCGRCHTGASLHHNGSSLRCDVPKTHLCRDCGPRRSSTYLRRCSNDRVQDRNDFVVPSHVANSADPMKTPHNPTSLTYRHWSHLQKPETSAEKVGRWQSDILDGKGEVQDVAHQRSTGSDPLHKSQISVSPGIKSPGRFFPHLPGHDYKDANDGSPRTTPKMSSNNTSRQDFEYKPKNSDHMLEGHLGERNIRGAASARRSSMYTLNVQKELERYLQDGRSVLFDVTSPGHPYVEFKSVSGRKVSSGEVFPLSPPARETVHGVPSWTHLDKRLSSDGNVSESSCNTFVTCEDDTEFTAVTPVDTITTVSSAYRDTTLDDCKPHKVDDLTNGDSQNVAYTAIKKRSASAPHLKSKSPRKHQHPSRPMRDLELDLTSDLKSRLSNSGCRGRRKISNKVQSDIRSFSPSKHQWQAPANVVMDLNMSDLVTSDDSYFERTGNSSAKHALSSDRNSSSVKSQVKKTVQNWLAPSVLDDIDEADLITSDESFQQRVRHNKNNGNKVYNLADELGNVSVTERTSPRNQNGKNRISLESGASNASVKEYLYRDEEKGITLLERVVPSTCDENSTTDSLSSSYSTWATNSEDTEIYNWQDYQTDTDDSVITTRRRAVATPAVEVRKTPVTPSLSRLSNEEIRKKLQSLGDNPGPVVATTRQAYLVRLASFEADPSMVKQMKLSTDVPEYSPELRAALQGNLDSATVEEMESKMICSFENSQGRCWREGTQKSSFNYLLLDPRVTRNLPLRAKTLSQAETFKAFIHAIFYVGKGKRARPYCHLYEAIRHIQNPKPKVSSKVQHIMDIWNEGLGVVSLHCFQSVIPVEAYTREACMVEAVGLSKLTNVKRGDYYGAASTWTLKSKKTLGVHLLQKALQIFLGEGERQISPIDMKTGSDKF